MKGAVLGARWEPKKDYKITDWESRTKTAITASSVWQNPMLELKEVEKPKANSREVLLEIRACGICGTDVHLVEFSQDKYVIYPGLVHLPVILGHEFSGIVVDKGSEVVDLKIGDYVTAEEMVWCGECIHCRNGFPNQCERLQEIGITINGAMASYLAVPEKLCWKINGFKKVYNDEELLFDVGATIEPTSVAYNAIFERGGGLRPGQVAVVFGCGPVGLLGISLLKTAGASKVLVFEPSRERANLSLKMGADKFYDPTELEKSGRSIESVIFDETDNLGADFYLETAGVPNITTPIMLNTMNVGARIVQTARSSESTPVYLEKLQTRAAQLFGSQGHSGNGTFQNVIRLIEAGMIKPEKIITSKYSLDDSIEAFEKAKKRIDAKIIINP